MVAAALLLALLAACGGGRKVGGLETGGTGTIKGLVVKGVVGASTLTLYPLDSTMTRGTALTTGVTASDGTFSIDVPPYNGPLEIVAFGGTYVDEAVGVPVQLTSELVYVVPAYESGSTVTATVSPVSSVARALAKAAVLRGASIADATTTVWSHVNNHFGGIDWRAVVPTNVAPSEATTVTMSDATKAGLILAGLSQLARLLAEQSSLTPGGVVTAGTLSGALAQDATDGTLDGNSGASSLLQGSMVLNGQTLRRGLGQAIVKFVASSRNKTQLTAADVLSLATGLAADSDAYLFCANQTAVASCAGGSLDLQAPTVALVDPPAYLSTKSVTLKATASSSVASISAVYAQTPTMATPIAGALAPNGVWALPEIPLADGPNRISIWAVDSAGTGSVASAVVIQVTRDPYVPTPYVTTTASYYDERQMMLASGATPGTYVFPEGAAKLSAVDAAGVFKAATRLAWASVPDTGTLEGSNPDNVPFVQFGLPTTASRAPITNAAYSISDGTSTFTGDLSRWLSPQSTDSVAYYDVPLTSNLVTSLGSTSGTVSLTVTVTFTNAAGTTGSVSTNTIPFHVVGPPLWIEQDAAWAGVTDVRGAHAYTRAGGTYATMWNTYSSAFINGKVRLVRYVISNPAPAPVAVSAAIAQDAGGSWRAVETWTLFDAGVRSPSAPDPTCRCAYSDVPYELDGFTFLAYTQFPFRSSSNAGYACVENMAYPCAADQLLSHPSGTLTKFTCIDGATFSSGTSPAWGGPLVRSASDVTADAFDFASNAQETSGAARDGGNTMYIVPAASGTTPGRVTLYVARPAGAARSTPLAWNTYTAGNRYEAYWGEFFAYKKWWFIVNGCSSYMYTEHIGAVWLSAAEDRLHGSMSVSTRGVVPGSSTLSGEATGRYSVAWGGTVAVH